MRLCLTGLPTAFYACLPSHVAALSCAKLVQRVMGVSGLHRLEDGARRPLRELESASLGIAADNRTQLQGALSSDTTTTNDSTSSGLAGTLYTGEDEVFAFARSRSRLLAMQSRRYIVLARGYS